MIHSRWKNIVCSYQWLRFTRILFLDIIRLRNIAIGRFRVTRDHEIWKSMSKLIPVVLRSISCEQTHRRFFTKIKCHVKWVHGTSPTCFLIKNGWYYSNGAAAASYMILPSTVLISLVYRMFRSAMFAFRQTWTVCFYYTIFVHQSYCLIKEIW